MNSSSWGSSWGGTFLSMRFWGEDFADELGDAAQGSHVNGIARATRSVAINAATTNIKQPNSFSIASHSAPTPRKEYTSEELQEHMKRLMTSHPELWKEYKQGLSKEENPTHPETVRRVLIDFLNRHGDLSATKPKTSQEKDSVAVQWRPGTSPTSKRRPRQTASSLVNSLKDSLHRSLHNEELHFPPQQRQRSPKSSMSPLPASPRRLPPRQGSTPLRQGISGKRNNRSSLEEDSEHSSSSASFHDEDDDEVRAMGMPALRSAIPTLKPDTTQQKLMRLQQIPHLWMIYQSDRLQEQTMTGFDEGKGAEVESEKCDEQSAPNKPFVPTADQSSLQAFWDAHEMEILEFEKEEEQTRITAAEEAKRRRAASRIHIELNTSFHLEASAPSEPRIQFGASNHSGMQTISDHSAKIQQDTIQKKLTRIQQSPDLDMAFQRLLAEKEDPKRAETIQNTVEEFWLAHEKDVIEFERRSSLLYVDLNTSFHDEAVRVYRPSKSSSKSGNETKNESSSGSSKEVDRRANFATQRESLSTRSFRSIRMAVIDLTGELENSATDVSRRETNPGNIGRTGRRAKTMEMYKQQGEGFSSRSMRSVRVAIDGLAGEIGADSAPAESTDSTSSEPGGMLSFISGVMRDSGTPSAAQESSQGLFRRLSDLLTQDLESEVTSHEDRTPLTQQTTPQPPSPLDALGPHLHFDRSVRDDVIAEEEDDGFFEEAAQIAESMRRRDRAPEDETNTCDEEHKAEEEDSDPMKVFLRDPMLEVTMHNDTEEGGEEEQNDSGSNLDAVNGETVAVEEIMESITPEHGKTKDVDDGKDDDSLL